MLIGVPKEIKTHEYRVGLVPASVRELIHNGHRSWSRPAPGPASASTTRPMRARARRIAKSAAEVFAKAEMIVKVKEPQPDECKMLRKGQLLFTYLHLAPDPEQTEGLIEVRLHRHRLRDGDERARRPAAAGADERGRGPHVDPGRRPLPGEGAGRRRHPAGRRARRRAGARW